jgi:HAD superfamily hydrolase (TIGR01509 family)
VTAAVVFDLDGVLLDSEQVWNEAKRELVEEHGGRWREQAPRDMMGMSSPEWSRYLIDELGVPLEPAAVSDEVVARLERIYRARLPLLDGAPEAVRRLAGRFPLGLASSSNREIIDLFLELTGLAKHFAVTLSSEEVARGKPAPDVYLEAVRRLGAEPERCAAVEDSENGIRAARAAGVRVLALPNPHYPPAAEALALADDVLGSLAELDPARVAGYRIREAGPRDEPLLEAMLRLAMGWRERGAPPPVAPELKDLYVAGFGRPGDGGAVAEEVKGGPIGAAWFRLFEPDRHGYGFVAPDVPELSLAVAPEHRRRGLGRDLLEHALRRAKEAGHREVSLSVEPDNRALRLYERLGFERAGKSGGAWTLIRRSPAL